MDEKNAKKPIWSWLKWVLLAIVIVIIGIGIYLYSYYILWMRMDTKMVSNAEASFKNGFTVTDKKDDFITLGTNKEEVNSENNLSPYSIPYFDIKSVSLGVDSKYLYYKMSFWEKIPNKPNTVDGDTMVSVGTKMHIFDDKKDESVIICTSYGWLPIIKYPATNTYYFTDPTGIIWPEEDRFLNQRRDGKIFGGTGYDYILGAFPLDKLNLGDEVVVSFDIETESEKYTHAAVDILQGKGKTASPIKWKVGTNKFEVLEVEEEYQAN